MYYPANYGFIPQTYCDDHDPLDILVLSQIAIQPLCMVEAKVIGAMRLLDGDEKDDKIIAVSLNDMSVNHVEDVSDFFLELRNFFEDYKKLEHKTVIVEEFQKKDTALDVIRQSIVDFGEYMKKKNYSFEAH